MICLATKQLGVLKRSFELVLQYSCVQDEIEIFKLLLFEEKERRGESGEALGATKKKKQNMITYTWCRNHRRDLNTKKMWPNTELSNVLVFR